MKKSKRTIKLHDHYEQLSITRVYDIEDQLCNARVTVYAMVDNGEVDITDSEVEFYLNGKSCNYRGFKELYTSLFSEVEFHNYHQDLCKQAGDAVHDGYDTLNKIYNNDVRSTM